MRKSALAILLCTVATFVTEAQLPAGFVLHFEPAKQTGARSEANLPAIGNGQPVDLLLDGSTGKRLATQPIPDRRPIFVFDGASAYLKFDGKDDFLALQGVVPGEKELTLFVLAAPKENPGFFSGMFGAAALGQNDYTSGFNFDFGPAPTKEISVLNVESAGATGFRDLLTPGFFNATERPFADFHVFTVRTKIGTNGTEVFLDGFKGGQRERADSRIAMDQVIIGGRIYSNDANQAPFAQGFFNGAIAEILLYDRAVSEAERLSVEQFLLAKTVGLNALLHGLKGHALEPVKDPPAVQMFVPGFTVEELPLKIGNLTNVRYRHDGKLVGQGYDGRIYLLTDTNGDGLEDKAEFFWEQQTLRSPIGIALTEKTIRGAAVFLLRAKQKCR